MGWGGGVVCVVRACAWGAVGVGGEGGGGGILLVTVWVRVCAAGGLECAAGRLWGGEAAGEVCVESICVGGRAARCARVSVHAVCCDGLGILRALCVRVRACACVCLGEELAKALRQAWGCWCVCAGGDWAGGAWRGGRSESAKRRVQRCGRARCAVWLCRVAGLVLWRRWQ